MTIDNSKLDEVNQKDKGVTTESIKSDLKKNLETPENTVKNKDGDIVDPEAEEEKKQIETARQKLMNINIEEMMDFIKNYTSLSDGLLDISIDNFLKNKINKHKLSPTEVELTEAKEAIKKLINTLRELQKEASNNK